MEIDLTKLTPNIRRLNDMREVLADKKFAENSADTDLYSMYRGLEKSGELRYDATVIFAKMLGNEFNKTKGHYHIGAYPELYMVLEGQALYLLSHCARSGEARQKPDYGIIDDVYAVTVKKGECAIMPPFYGHVTINPSKTENLKMANWISDNCKSDYSPFIEKQGACYYYILRPGSGQATWIKNENYKTVPKLRFEEPLKNIPQDLNFLKQG